MTVHSNGNGDGWNTQLDVNQPHGLDYREWQDIRKGIQKREAKQHVSYADNTVGGEHKRGGCSILDVVDNSTDISATDGTYVGGGLVYQKGVGLWCFTSLTEYTTSTSAHQIKIAPTSICKGADFTWTGEHQFDNTATFTDRVDFSSVGITGDVTIDGAVDITGRVIIDGSVDVSGAGVVDGTWNFNDLVDFSTVNIEKVDSTAIQFGGTAGIGLFFDPTNYTTAASKESIKFPNGLIMKQGCAVGKSADFTVSFAAAFPNAIVNAQIQYRKDSLDAGDMHLGDVSKSKFTCLLSGIADVDVYWFALGY